MEAIALETITLTSDRIEQFKALFADIVPFDSFYVGNDFLRLNGVDVHVDNIAKIKRKTVLDMNIRAHFDEILAEKVEKLEAHVAELFKKSRKSVFKMALSDLMKHDFTQVQREITQKKHFEEASSKLKAQYKKLLGLYNQAYLCYREVYAIEFFDGQKFYIDTRAKDKLLAFLEKHELI